MLEGHSPSFDKTLRGNTMARMHGGAKGRSGSKKPAGKTGYSWLSLKPKEVELLIVKLAKEGKSASQVGLILRDTYGIPDVRVLLKKRITDVLRDKKLIKELPDDVLALIKKAVAIMKHMEANKVDMLAKRGLQLTESKIHRLVKYYKRSGRIQESWNYDPTKAGIYAE